MVGSSLATVAGVHDGVELLFLQPVCEKKIANVSKAPKKVFIGKFLNRKYRMVGSCRKIVYLTDLTPGSCKE